MFKILRVNQHDSCCFSYSLQEDERFTDPIPDPKLLATILAAGEQVFELGVDELPALTHGADPREIYDIRSKLYSYSHVFAWKEQPPGADPGVLRAVYIVAHDVE